MNLHNFKHLCEYLEGARDEPPSDIHPAGRRLLLSRLLRGVWWGILAAAMLLFCGQTSKFIYIDF